MDSIAAYQGLLTQPSANPGQGTPAGESAKALAPGHAPDRVHISDQAREFLAAKMAEHGAETPGDLTPEQRAEVKRAMAESDEVSDRDRAALAQTAERADREGPPPADKDEKAREQRKPQSGQAAAAGDSEEVQDLKDDIEELEEVEELTGKTLHDPDAKRELRDKRIELLTLEAELTLEELKQQMG
jgi:uncharacterized protein (DUF1800 family)